MSSLPDLGNRWNIVDSKGNSGGNADVYRARDNLEIIEGDVAVKVLRRFDRYHRFKTEVMKASDLKHRNIVPILDSHLTSEPHKSKPPYYVMPWWKEGALILKPELTINEVLQYIAQLVEALQYLHNKQLAHRDIKPSNLLVDSTGTLGLTDFGLVRDIASDLRDTMCDEPVGSRGYMAPELAGGRSKDAENRPADIYSTGRVVWALAAGIHPPIDNDLSESSYNLVEKRGTQWLEIQDLVRLTTLPRPSDRLTIDELSEIIIPTETIACTPLDGTIAIKRVSQLYANDSEYIEKSRSAKEKSRHEKAVKQFAKELNIHLMRNSEIRKIRSEAEKSPFVAVKNIRRNEDINPIEFVVQFGQIEISLRFIIQSVDIHYIGFTTYVTIGRLPGERLPDTFFSISRARFTEKLKKQLFGKIPRQVGHLINAINAHCDEKLGV